MWSTWKPPVHTTVTPYFLAAFSANMRHMTSSLCPVTFNTEDVVLVDSSPVSERRGTASTAVPIWGLSPPWTVIRISSPIWQADICNFANDNAISVSIVLLLSLLSQCINNVSSYIKIIWQCLKLFPVIQIHCRYDSWRLASCQKDCREMSDWKIRFGWFHEKFQPLMPPNINSFFYKEL